MIKFSNLDIIVNQGKHKHIPSRYYLHTHLIYIFGFDATVKREQEGPLAGK